MAGILHITNEQHECWKSENNLKAISKATIFVWFLKKAGVYSLILKSFSLTCVQLECACKQYLIACIKAQKVTQFILLQKVRHLFDNNVYKMSVKNINCFLTEGYLVILPQNCFRRGSFN